MPHRKRTSNGTTRPVAKPQRFGTLELLEGRCLLSRTGPGIWNISGDRGGRDQADQIVISRSENNPSLLQVTVNGNLVATRPDARLRGIRISAGAGDDTVTIDQSAGRIAVPITVWGGAGDDVIIGGAGRDLLDGGAGRDTLRGGDGNDRLDGAAGSDRLYGSAGNDKLAGGDGDDTLTGQGDDATVAAATFGRSARTATDNDSLDGGAGDNVLVGSGGSDVLTNGREPQSIEQLGSCADVAQRLADQASKWYGGGWGWPGPIFPIDDTLRVETTAAVGNGAAGDAAPTFSSTNTQEQGVDEADIVKTDGQFIYVLRDGELIIVDSLPVEDAHVVSRTTIEGYGVDMFVRGNRVMIFSSVWVEDPPTDPGDEEEPIDPIDDINAGSRLAVDIAIASLWWPTGTLNVKVTVLDISDRAAPELIHESYLEGSYIQSRAIGGQVYVILDNTPRAPFFLAPIVLRKRDPNGWAAAQQLIDDLAAADPESYLPRFRSRDLTDQGWVEQTGNLLIDCSSLYKMPDDDFLNMTSVLSFDMDADQIGGPADSATVFGNVYTVYASTDNIYLVGQEWSETGDTATIHKLALGADITWQASGEVPGQVLNQFSLDEHGDQFRIATTENDWSDGRNHTENHLFVMTQQGDTLNVVGDVSMAPDERIFSARFFDDHAFVVTFRQIDPLFAIDLTDPRDPQIMGELKVTGFSSYLHPVGDDHLLAIGRDADENGRVNGLQVSLFDVSDLNNPSLVDSYLITPEGGWSWSAAEWDHHAFAYFAESGVLSVPVEGGRYVEPACDGDELCWPEWRHQSEFWVLQVDLSAGFSLLGQVAHDTTALRSLRINDTLFTVAYDDLKAQPLTDPATNTVTVSLA